MSWEYRGGDAGVSLFSAALAAGAPLSFPDGGRVLEVGACESDWLERAADAWPNVAFWGLDQRKRKGPHRPNTALVQGDVRNPDLFSEGQFDAIVSLSAIEHIGLGHYDDPRDPNGDTQAITNCWRWLKPGGTLYFDVPYNPEAYQVLNTECRIYDDTALFERLWMQPLVDVKGRARWLWDGYVGSDAPGTLVIKPQHAHRRYWYVALCWSKAIE